MEERATFELPEYQSDYQPGLGNIKVLPGGGKSPTFEVTWSGPPAGTMRVGDRGRLDLNFRMHSPQPIMNPVKAWEVEIPLGQAITTIGGWSFRTVGLDSTNSWFRAVSKMFVTQVAKAWKCKIKVNLSNQPGTFPFAISNDCMLTVEDIVYKAIAPRRILEDLDDLELDWLFIEHDEQ